MSDCVYSVFLHGHVASMSVCIVITQDQTLQFTVFCLPTPSSTLIENKLSKTNVQLSELSSDSYDFTLVNLSFSILQFLSEDL